MNKPKHTPTPWYVAYGCIYDANNNCVAKADRHESNRLTPVERDKNIESIAMAVNAHDELLEALETLVTAIAAGKTIFDVRGGSMDKARAALAKAKD